MASILILGGGFGGLAAAHELRARLPDDHEVTVVAADDRFYAGFAKLWDLVGTRPLEQGTASLSTLEASRYPLRPDPRHDDRPVRASSRDGGGLIQR